MNKSKFLKLFGEDHLFSAYDYKKVLPPVDSIKNLKELRSLNIEGYCIFFAVNKMKKGKTRSNKNCQSIRAIWIDDDKPRKTPRKKFLIPPSIIVQTSAHEIKGVTKYKYQYYWLTSTTEFKEFELVMQTMIDKYGNDKGVRDLARVLRIPGFNHMKDRDNPHRVKVVGGTCQTHSWEKIKIAFPPAKEMKSSTKEKGEYSKNKARQAISESDDYHGSLRDRAMELANNKLDADDIVSILRDNMYNVPEANRDKRWQDRVSDEHLYECAESAVIKYEEEDHGGNYEVADISDHSKHISAPKLSRNIISPPDTVIGELTEELYKTWWIPNIMIAGLAARSIVAHFAGGKYRSSLGDRVNIQQVAIGETGCGKDLLFNQFSNVIDQMYPPENGREHEEGKVLNRGVIEEVGSPEGIDMKLRTCGKKHDVIWLQDEIGGLMQAARKDNRKREILEMLLKFYTKSDTTVSERALVKKLPENAAEILYAPHISLSGATTPKLITQGLDSSFLSYGSASRMVFFPVGQYIEEQVREKANIKLGKSLKLKLKKISLQKKEDIFDYPIARVRSPVIVEFSEEATSLCHEESLRIRNDKMFNLEVWNRYVANAKKYAMIDAIAENPKRPKICKKIMKRNLKMIASACEYTCELFANEVGETDYDVAKNKVLTLMGNYGKDGKVVKMSDINNMRPVRKLRANEKFALLKEMESEGSIVKVEKDNGRGKPTITFRLA